MGPKYWLGVNSKRSKTKKMFDREVRSIYQSGFWKLEKSRPFITIFGKEEKSAWGQKEICQTLFNSLAAPTAPPDSLEAMWCWLNSGWNLWESWTLQQLFYIGHMPMRWVFFVGQVWSLCTLEHKKGSRHLLTFANISLRIYLSD